MMNRGTNMRTSVLAIAAAAAVAASVGPVAAAPMIKPIASGGACSIDIVGGVPYIQHGAVLGGVTVYCTTRPRNAHVAIYLEHRSRQGGWAARATEVIDVRPDPQITQGIWASCEDGLWQIVADMWETTAAGETVQTRSTSSPTIIAC